MEKKEISTAADSVQSVDEAWLCYYDPSVKQQSSEWKHPSSPTLKKAKTVKSAGDGRIFPSPQSHGKIVEVEIGGVATYRPFEEFRRANLHSHLYGAQGLGQRQAYFYPLATMNFVGLVLTTSDSWH
ncbi:hypothetical protein TNCV_1715101 [Trichonephila clavipes]|nr:hypothetical protein TNCV_1715101 [Trichonephila clavipes]